MPTGYGIIELDPRFFVSFVNVFQITSSVYTEKKVNTSHVSIILANQIWLRNINVTLLYLAVSLALTRFELPLQKKWRFFIKDFFSKWDPIRSKLRIWSHLLKNSLTFVRCSDSWLEPTVISFSPFLMTTHSNRFLKAHSEMLDNFWQPKALLKMMQNPFYFTLKAHSVLKIFKFLSWLFGHLEQRLD